MLTQEFRRYRVAADAVPAERRDDHVAAPGPCEVCRGEAHKDVLGYRRPIGEGLTRALAGAPVPAVGALVPADVDRVRPLVAVDPPEKSGEHRGPLRVRKPSYDDVSTLSHDNLSHFFPVERDQLERRLAEDEDPDPFRPTDFQEFREAFTGSIATYTGKFVGDDVVAPLGRVTAVGLVEELVPERAEHGRVDGRKRLLELPRRREADDGVAPAQPPEREPALPGHAILEGRIQSDLAELVLDGAIQVGLGPPQALVQVLELRADHGVRRLEEELPRVEVRGRN